MSKLDDIINNLFVIFINKISRDFDIEKIDLLNLLKKIPFTISKSSNGKCSGFNVNGKACALKAVENGFCKRHGNPTGKKKTKTVLKSEAEKKIASLCYKPSQLQIRKNKYGHYEEPGTGFCFEKSGEKPMVIGKCGPKGELLPLTAENIDKCISNKWDYRMPLQIISGRIVKKIVDADSEDEDEGEDDEIIDD